GLVLRRCLHHVNTCRCVNVGHAALTSRDGLRAGAIAPVQGVAHGRHVPERKANSRRGAGLGNGGTRQQKIEVLAELRGVAVRVGGSGGEVVLAGGKGGKSAGRKGGVPAAVRRDVGEAEIRLALAVARGIGGRVGEEFDPEGGVGLAVQRAAN